MLSDILESTREAVLERLASPLIGSFFIAWCIWNYRFLVILFSDATVSQTFDLVDTQAFPDQLTVILRGMAYPLFTALAYVFLYPYPAKMVYGYTRRRQVELGRLRQKIEDETPLTLEESREIRSQFRDADRKYREIIDHLNAEVARLTAKPRELEGENKAPPLTQAERMYGFLEPSQINILRMLEKHGAPLSESNILSQAGESNIKMEFDLGELTRRNLLIRDYQSDEDQWYYDFTHEGRRELLQKSGANA